jgi:hypothetical protein
MRDHETSTPSPRGRTPPSQSIWSSHPQFSIGVLRT